jgi:deoxyribodipyrimidine photolyase-related protein
MRIFSRQLQALQPDPAHRSWIFVAYDQLSDEIGPLSREDPRTLGIVLVENTWKAARRPYHKQKLALILTNLRHFALEQAARGVAVRHVTADRPYHEALKPLLSELGSLRMMPPAERELRSDLEPLVRAGDITYVRHDGWLTSEHDFRASSTGKPPWRMDAFYRHTRRASGVLMHNGKPVGGKFSFDAENRLPWKGEPVPPPLPSFPVDDISREVGSLIETQFSHHPGQLHMQGLPASKDDAQTLWKWAQHNCLPFFGPYEDAMSHRSTTLFHTRISSLIHLHRLLPRRVIEDALRADVSLPSREGFIRQVLGWREFMHHVHETSDGFRILPDSDPPISARPGDGGYHRWAGHPWTSRPSSAGPDGGAAPSYLGAEAPLPPLFWGTPSGFNCVDTIVSTVWEEGYSHHITRLMVLSNLATLLDISPRELADWFWAAYIDAYDWVVEPNVLGMGTFALGDLMVTKPYVSGARYIHRMGDYCGDCTFDPRTDCPFTPLYWAFLARHRASLAANPRLRIVMASLRRRDRDRRRADEAVFRHVSSVLARGETVRSQDVLVLV